MSAGDSGEFRPNGLTKLLVSVMVVAIWGFVVYFRLTHSGVLGWTEQLLTVTVVAVVARMHGLKPRDILQKR